MPVKSDPIDRLRAANPVPLADAAASMPFQLPQAVDRQVRRRRLVPAALLAVSLAALLVVLGALIGGGEGRSRLDPLSQARAALAPDGKILHLRMTVTYIGQTDPASHTIDQWIASDPPRWRLLHGQSTPGASSAYAGAPAEYVYADGTLRSRDPKTGRLQVSHGPTAGPAAESPGFLGPSVGGDPAASLAGALAAGRVTDAGEHTVDGRTVRRLITAVVPESTYFSRFTYDVDPKSFAPVGGTMEFGPRPDDVKPAIRFHVDSYERLPANDANEHLLRLTSR